MAEEKKESPEGGSDEQNLINKLEDNDTPLPVTSVPMKLLDMRLKPSGAILQSLIGDFTCQSKSQELCVAKTSGALELYQITTVLSSSSEVSDDNDDDDDPRTILKLMARLECHCIIQSIAKVTLEGEKRDLLVIASDAGTLSIYDWKHKTNSQVVTFGKTQCRRSTPGSYLCSDPKGRAVMIAALEKRKLVYVLNHASGKTTVASPLEAHRSRTITIYTCGVDNGYDNPLFGVLEMQYPEEGATTNTSVIEKQLALYELDLGLNHVSRKWARTVHPSAACLAALPGGSDGPSGVLVGIEDGIEYHHPDIAEPVVCVVPRRVWDNHANGKPVLITHIVVHRQKKYKFFALAQSELGDVYKVGFEWNDDKRVQGLTVCVLDTLPCANSLNVSKAGMLFVAAEFGDHGLYQFERIDLPDAPTNVSQDLQQDKLISTTKAIQVAKTFTPGPLQNLRKLVTLDNPSPTTGVLVGELAGNEVSPQIYTLAGKGPTSSLRILRHGASVTELAVSELPGIPGGIFTIDQEQDTKSGGLTLSKYIVVSFADATLVLSVGDTVEEVGKESGFLINAPTLSCSSLKGGGMCQVHPVGVRHIVGNTAKQWNCPGLARIEYASANSCQVLISLSGGQVIYFELDSLSGNLNESKHEKMTADVCCLCVGAIAKGSSRSLFAAVGCRDQTVKIVSLEPGKLLKTKASTSLKSRPHSVRLLQPNSAGDGGGDIVLMIGLEDGSSLRATVDPITGAIGTSPTRRFLGARPVTVSRIPLEGKSAMLLLSSRPWISRLDTASGKHVMAPLSYAPLDHGCAFSSEAVREGVVATAGKTLRIISVDTVGMEGGEEESFNTNRVPLRYTPRQMTLLSTTSSSGGPPDQPAQRKVVLAVVESDYNDYGQEEKDRMGFDPNPHKKKKAQKEDDGMDMDSDDEDAAAAAETKQPEPEESESEDEEELAARSTPIRGPVPPSAGHWGSCIRLLDPSDSCKTLDCVEMNRNEAALCCTSVRFHTQSGESLLAVGTVTEMTMHPLNQTASHVILYRVVNGDRLQLLHRTTIDDGPVLALAHFQGRLLVGIGKTLRLYEMGKRQLLRKCELRGLPTFVKTLQAAGDRYV